MIYKFLLVRIPRQIQKYIKGSTMTKRLKRTAVKSCPFQQLFSCMDFYPSQSIQSRLKRNQMTSSPQEFLNISLILHTVQLNEHFAIS